MISSKKRMNSSVRSSQAMAILHAALLFQTRPTPGEGVDESVTTTGALPAPGTVSSSVFLSPYPPPTFRIGAEK